MKRINADTCIGIAFALFSLALLWVTRLIPDDQPYGPTAFPSLVGKVMFALGVALAIQSIWRSGVPKFEFSREGLVRVAVIVALSVVYTILLPIIGFLAATLLLFAPILWMFGLRQKKLFITIALCAPILIYLVFQFVLKVPLP